MKSNRIASTIVSGLASILTVGVIANAEQPRKNLLLRSTAVGANVQRIDVDSAMFRELSDGPARRSLTCPLPSGEIVILDVDRFDVVGPDCKFVEMTPHGPVAMARPDVVLFRGKIANEPMSHVFLALSAERIGNGYVDRGGQRFFIATDRDAAGQMTPGALTIHPAPVIQDESEAAVFCGVDRSHDRRKLAAPHVRGGPPNNRGMRMAKIAVEADQEFVQLFPSNAAATAYLISLVAATDDIYRRDLNLRLRLDFVRTWPAGGEPFDAGDLGGFGDYWVFNESPNLYNYIHLYSGQRSMSYAGIAYVGGRCATGRTYGISGFLNGTFPPAFGPPSLDNWDVIVTTHEMGHNSGTFHTHDGYDPTIDDCGNGVPSRGTIMSYCHTHPGGVLNIDMWMHRQVEDVIEEDGASGDCFAYDCNGNGIPDDFDSTHDGSDVNGDGIPDTCQDCNGNSILDPVEIVGGAPDVNGNNIPDSCEPDCNQNGVPDPFECDLNPAIDLDGDNTPDSCQADCNGNSIPDFIDVRPGGGFADVDRNNVPDVCQDCDGNGISDWLDLGRGENLYVCDQSADVVREYYSLSGYPIQNLGAGAVLDPLDCIFGSDRQLYVASFGNDRIVRINVDTGATSIFVAAGSGGLDGPSSLVFGPTGDLFVGSRINSRIIRYNGATGALIGTFVAAGVGGLNQPHGLIFGADGNLYVSNANNAILRYNGTTGASLGAFVAPNSGGLNGPRGLTFLPNGRLLVSSFSSNTLLQYNGATGAFISQFNNGPTMNNPWGVRVGPDGRVYAVRSTTTIRVQQYKNDTGLYLRAFVRADTGLPSPTGLAFRPGFTNDCNGNRVPDACDPESTDIDLFVHELLADPQLQASICLFDQNADGLLDGRDVSGFTAKVLTP
jgi:hypothetical protein